MLNIHPNKILFIEKLNNLRAIVNIINQLYLVFLVKKHNEFLLPLILKINKHKTSILIKLMDKALIILINNIEQVPMEQIIKFDQIPPVLIHWLQIQW